MLGNSLKISPCHAFVKKLWQKNLRAKNATFPPELDRDKWAEVDIGNYIGSGSVASQSGQSSEGGHSWGACLFWLSGRCWIGASVVRLVR